MNETRSPSESAQSNKDEMDRGEKAAREWLATKPCEEILHYRQHFPQGCYPLTKIDRDSVPGFFGWSDPAEFWREVLGDDHDPVSPTFARGFMREVDSQLSKLPPPEFA